MKSILLVGGGGFIGSFIARELVEKGYRPIVFDSFYQYLPTLTPDEHKLKALKKRFDDIEDKIILIRGDATNYGEVRRVFEEYEPASVIHLAGIPLASLSNIYVEEALDSVRSTGTIIQVIKDMQADTRFVYTSSSTVYGDFEYDPADEDHPKKTRGVYAGVKMAGENITKAFCRQFKIPWVIIRPSAVYGPTDVNRRVIQIFIENARSGKKLEVRDPTNSLDFTYVKDTAHGFVLAALHPKAPGNVFNITTGEGRTLGELAEIIKSYYPEVEIEIAEADKHLPRRGGLDIARAKKILGFEPQYNLEKGVKEYVEYYEQNE